MKKQSGEQPLDPGNLHLLQELLVATIRARQAMDFASARADLLINILNATVESIGTEDNFAYRAISNVELDLLDNRDAPEPLRKATMAVARAIWVYRREPSKDTDLHARAAFERWETLYREQLGELPSDTYMDMENARCRAEPDYYGNEPPLPFASRVRLEKGN